MINFVYTPTYTNKQVNNEHHPKVVVHESRNPPHNSSQHQPTRTCTSSENIPKSSPKHPENHLNVIPTTAPNNQLTTI